MTSVGSTTYYPSTSSRANAGPAGRASESAYTALYDNQERETKPQTKAAVETAVPDASVDTAPSTATVNLQGKLVEISLLGTVLNLREIKPDWENPDGWSQGRLRDMETMLEDQYTRMPEEPDPSDYPGTQTYAEIVVKGKVVATIDNQGIAFPVDKSLSERYRNAMASINGTYGPDMAERVAKAIAKALGGSIVKQDTALTQAQFENLSYEPPQPWIDYDAMFADPQYAQLQEMRQKRDDYLAQLQAGGAPQVPSSGN